VPCNSTFRYSYPDQMESMMSPTIYHPLRCHSSGRLRVVETLNRPSAVLSSQANTATLEEQLSRAKAEVRALRRPLVLVPHATNGALLM